MLSNHKSYAKIALTIIMLLTMLLLAISCRECPTEPDYDIYLAVEDVACVWVTLKVTLPDSGKINRFELDRNDSTVAAYTCYDNDTLITDEGLIPDKDYSYTVRFLKDGKTKAESEPVTVHTMPTTSHNFVWEIDTLGNYGSYLNDVWIIDENDIWVVGYLRVDDPDSSFDGTGQGTFNAAKWDGEKWNLMLIVNPDPLYSIFYFNENDMWMSNGLPIHWDGNNWTLYHIQQMGISANVEYGIWGTSSLDIYFVGRFGSIVHYDGSTFRKIETDTDVDFRDIDGTPDGKRIYATGYNLRIPSYSSVFEIKGNSIIRFYFVENPYQEGTYGYVSAVSVKDHFVYFSTPSGIWRYDFENKVSSIMNVDEIECGELIVNDYNDIIGYRGGMGYIHYNGKDWRKERYLENHIFSCNGGDYKNGLAVMVGYTPGWQAVVAKGYHQ